MATNYTRTQKMRRLAEIIAANPEMHFTGSLNSVGHELIVWPGQSTSGHEGWFLGEFAYYTKGPWRPTLHTKFFYSDKETAMADIEKHRSAWENDCL